MFNFARLVSNLVPGLAAKAAALTPHNHAEVSFAPDEDFAFCERSVAESMSRLEELKQKFGVQDKPSYFDRNSSEGHIVRTYSNRAVITMDQMGHILKTKDVNNAVREYSTDPVTCVMRVSQRGQWQPFSRGMQLLDDGTLVSENNGKREYRRIDGSVLSVCLGTGKLIETNHLTMVDIAINPGEHSLFRRVDEHGTIEQHVLDAEGIISSTFMYSEPKHIIFEFASFLNELNVCRVDTEFDAMGKRVRETYQIGRNGLAGANTYATTLTLGNASITTRVEQVTVEYADEQQIDSVYVFKGPLTVRSAGHTRVFHARKSEMKLRIINTSKQAEIVNCDSGEFLDIVLNGGCSSTMKRLPLHHDQF